ncbi:unnamed protein product [Amaranthus hypochondriacus]
MSLLTLFLLIVIPFFLVSACISSHENQSSLNTSNNKEHEISHFRTLNRRKLIDCPFQKLYRNIKITVDAVSPLADDQNIVVTVSGIFFPSDRLWVAMITPADSNVRDCPLNGFFYVETGDLSKLPLLCHYPVKAAYLKSDPDFLPCKKSVCKKYGADGKCNVKTCSASLTFHVINIRTDITFVLFDNGFDTPCILKRTTTPLRFANPSKPLYGHISTVNSASTLDMRVRWVSASKEPQQVQLGDGKLVSSDVATFTQKDMCGGAAKDFGWHDPGYIHTAIITNLQPLANYSYKYGSNASGWSDNIQFRTPPAGGSSEVRFLAFGDMGKAPRDSTLEHYIQPGSLSVVDAMAEEVRSGAVDTIFHIGDISYATGFLVEWDYFLHLITPLASQVSYMTAIGNHERDHPNSGSVYNTPDSGGECGIAYETYFPMPTQAKDKPWYSIEHGPIHFTVISTEHQFHPLSEQYNWIRRDMASVNRTRTPWLIFTGHRPMYTSANPSFIPNVDQNFVVSIEPLLLQNQVDLVLFGHVHNYERTCAIYQGKCMAKPFRDENGIDTFDNSNYRAPIHVIIGMAGFALDGFSNIINEWSLKRISTFGYSKIFATREALKLQFINSITRQAEDAFQIIKK